MKAQWNTGRPYTVNGQRIVAEQREDGIYFNDIDRNLSGRLKTAYRAEDATELRSVVMGCYDHGHYQDIIHDNAPQWEQQA